MEFHVYKKTTITLYNRIYNCDDSELQLVDHSLKYIPNDIMHMINLKRLNLQNNNITLIPEFIFNLKNLEYLNLSGNIIKSIPYNICKLKNLKILYLNNNKLTHIPYSLCLLTKLENLRTYDNPCKDCISYAKPNCNNIQIIDFSMVKKEKEKIISAFIKKYVIPKYFEEVIEIYI